MRDEPNYREPKIWSGSRTLVPAKSARMWTFHGLGVIWFRLRDESTQELSDWAYLSLGNYGTPAAPDGSSASSSNNIATLSAVFDSGRVLLRNFAGSGATDRPGIMTIDFSTPITIVDITDESPDGVDGITVRRDGLTRTNVNDVIGYDVADLSDVAGINVNWSISTSRPATAETDIATNELNAITSPHDPYSLNGLRLSPRGSIKAGHVVLYSIEGLVTIDVTATPEQIVAAIAPVFGTPHFIFGGPLTSAELWIGTSDPADESPHTSGLTSSRISADATTVRSPLIGVTSYVVGTAGATIDVDTLS